MPLALSNGEVILIVVFAAIPVAAAAFIGVGTLYRQIGRGLFLDQDDLGDDELSEYELPGGRLRDSMAEGSGQAREDEIRQMLEAKAYRQRARGEEPLDVEHELRRLMNPAPIPGADPELVQEVRQLVVARNERRMRRGEEPLDVDAEVARQLREFESLGE